MKKTINFVLFLLLCGFETSLCIGAQKTVEKKRYEATWESLSSHPLPQWYDDAKFGMIIDWGLYSIPGWAPKKEKGAIYPDWYLHDMYTVRETMGYHYEQYGEDFESDDFIPMFKAEKYNPKYMVELAKKAGAKYVLIFTKHHDGFCLWPSEYTHRDAGEMGPNHDLLEPLVRAARAEGLKIGFYYSLYEWWNPSYTGKYIEGRCAGFIPVQDYVKDYMNPQVKELIDRYDPDLMWGDGEWDHPAGFWNSKELIAYYYNQTEGRKKVAVNDRWGAGTRGRYGDFFTSEYGAVYVGQPLRKKTEHKWEENRGISQSFGYNREDTEENVITVRDLIHMLVNTVSDNGNLLLIVNLDGTGALPEIQEKRLKEIGKWLEINGEAVYKTHPWIITPQEDIRFTHRGNSVYAICLEWPGESLLIDSLWAVEGSSIQLLGSEEKLNWRQDEEGLTIRVPPHVKKVLQYAYVFKIKVKSSQAEE